MTSTAMMPPDGAARARGFAASALAALLLAAATLTAPAAANQEDRDAALFQALRDGGHVAFMRHAQAPGNGDPEDFRLDDCATQRNLGEAGREQAARAGARFRAAGIESARVFSSQWCRCLDTAELLDLGPIEPLPPLNSIHRRAERRAPQMAALKAFLAGRSFEHPTLLVTHHSVIGAFTGVYPGSGEIVVVRTLPDGAVEPLGRIGPN